MAFRTEMLRRLGGFDPALGPGTPTRAAEDIDAFFRVVVAGCRLVYRPAAIVRHAHSRDYDRLSRQMYAYGVGVGAFLTKHAVQPRHAVAIARRVPSGLHYALSGSSAKNAQRSASFPRDLIHKEMAGQLHGPIAYLHSRVELALRLHTEYRSPSARTSGGVTT